MRQIILNLATRLFLTASLFSFLNLGTVASAAVLERISSNGEYAEFGYYSPCTSCSGYSYVWVSVSRNDTPSNRETFMSFYLESDGVEYAYGWGKIPNEDFNGGVLSTDLSRLTGEFYGGVATGPIEITWTKVALESNRFTGFRETGNYGLITRTTGTSRWGSARAYGTAFDTTIDTVGSIGSNQNTTLTFEKKLPMP